MGNNTTSSQMRKEERQRQRRLDEFSIAYTRYLIETKQFDKLKRMCDIQILKPGATEETDENEPSTDGKDIFGSQGAMALITTDTTTPLTLSSVLSLQRRAEIEENDDIEDIQEPLL